MPAPPGRDPYGRWYPDREWDTDPEPPRTYSSAESLFVKAVGWIVLGIVLIGSYIQHK